MLSRVQPKILLEVILKRGVGILDTLASKVGINLLLIVALRAVGFELFSLGLESLP